ncbi:PREDICTED: uncharacterized protein LOC104608649 isoform X2 [Nelumbo nucifera]|uniref:Uncharacterized protein LOC104608649 isoform X2 n=1 Tax=Nelumbo nucifera TaxID=4432 RepID=A0A1U8B1F7_NELNU|nr:PREDICTED: uncharacterized protein LOC104608649 isoform X2 [Nelumbo nucifera]
MRRITQTAFCVGLVVRFLLFFFLFASNSSAVVAADDDLSIVVAHPTTLQLSSGFPVKDSPGSKPSMSMVCNRVHIRGLSRLKSLRKYAHSLKVIVKVIQTGSGIRLQNVEVCFHRNMSLGIGMCPQGNWEKLVKGSWVRSMSPYDSKLLDIRMPGLTSEIFEVSTEEEFLSYRIFFLVIGVILITLAPEFGNSLVFYYSSAMTVGIILVVLMVLFQGMKLLPTGRKNSLAIFLFSSIVGIGSFFISYLLGLVHSLLIEMGFHEDMYNPLAIFLLVCVALAGAWLGFWVVRKLVVTEDGSVDKSIARFVTYSIWVFAAVMILQSSLDPLLAAVALVAGILISLLLRRVTKLRSSRHRHKHSSRLAKHNRRKLPNQDFPTEESDDEYQHKIRMLGESELFGTETRPFRLSSCNSSRGLAKTPPCRSLDSETYYSTYHKTPERKEFSKDEWDKFTRESTKKALEDLFSSPDFNKFAVANAERITLAPPKDHRSTSKQQGRWFI